MNFIIAINYKLINIFLSNYYLTNVIYINSCIVTFFNGKLFILIHFMKYIY